ARLSDSCDRRTAIGRRDFAILVLLSRLGLRVGEVAALRLEDLGWRAGELVIRGKGSRRERLPLPVDVGEAIVDWLREGRPDCHSRFVFTRARAPHDGLHPSSLNSVVGRACLRTRANWPPRATPSRSRPGTETAPVRLTARGSSCH